MSTVDYVLAVPLGLVLLYALSFWVFYPAKLLTVGLYRHIRYTQNGLCPKCHKPAELRTMPADQQYGPSQTSQLVCSCGHRSLKMGNRRWGDWAGF